MRTQYQTYIHTAEEIFSNVMALNGLCERHTVMHLQSVVADFFPQTFGLAALDLNAGRGVGAMALAELGFNVAAYDMYTNSISILQRIALQQDLNISFGMGGILQLEALNKKFDLIHDTECLNTMLTVEQQAQYLNSVKNVLTEDGKFVVTVQVRSENYDPTDSFESIRLDMNHLLWRETPACELPGIVEHNGRHWTVQKRIPTAELVMLELKNAGFNVLSDELEVIPGNNPALVKLVLSTNKC